jgi:hypothetical protein
MSKTDDSMPDQQRTNTNNNTPAAGAPEPPRGYMDLPAEIRLQIMEHLVHDEGPMVTLHNLLAASPVDYRLFQRYGASLLGSAERAKNFIKDIISNWWMW